MTPVTLTFPALTEHVALARTAAATLAAICDLGVGQVDDVRLAIDEAVSQLIVAAPGSMITCEFSASPDELLMQVRCDAVGAEAFDTGSFGWIIMSELVDSVSDDSASGHPGITLRIHRREHAQA